MKLGKIEKDTYYHIYNKGINDGAIFKNAENKRCFLKLANKYLSEKAVVLAYCLMDDHCHMAIRILSDKESGIQAFSDLFNAYTKAFNKREGKTGSLFERHYKWIPVNDKDYLRNLVVYIHLKPENHGISNDFGTFKFSSYHLFTPHNHKRLLEVGKKETLALFKGLEHMEYMHREKTGESVGLSGLQGFQNLVGLNKSTTKDKFYQYIQNLQDSITTKLEAIDGVSKFHEDLWERAEGGGGRTRVIENGGVFEKGGVNISAVYGELPESMQKYLDAKDTDFFTCGLSLVLHPKSPMVPTVHANWRYFEIYDKTGNIIDQWFGGGQDLTPYYLFDEDASYFHSVCKKVCDAHHPGFYTKYKKKCDDYFWNTHRNEARGIGGLFFDYCKSDGTMDMNDWYNFVTEVGNSFLDAYIPIVIKRKGLEYNQLQRDWQEIRRGRYVEFNLVHDKGTLFGLHTNGRIESILMSLPPHVQWHYGHHPEPGSEEERLLKVLAQPKNWAG